MSELYKKTSQKIDEDLAIIEANTLMESGDKAFRLIGRMAGGALALVAIVFWIPNLIALKTELATKGPIPWIYKSLSVDIEQWGQFGDFLGGLLNPIVGLATIYLVLINVRLQKRELSLALQEMKNSNSALDAQNAAIEIQNFQNTFFNWLNSYREVINDAQFETRGKVLVGASALRAFYKGEFAGVEIDFLFKGEGIEEFFPSFSDYETPADEETCRIIESILLDKWGQFKMNHYAAASSIKSLMGLIDWILNRAPTTKARHEYLDILSDQLSYVEIAFVMYEISKTRGYRLRELNRHKFFDKLNVLDDPSMYFMKVRSLHHNR